MAKTSYASLCILLFLLSVSGCALGLDGIEVLDRQSNISFQSTISFENKTSFTDPPGKALLHLPNGTAWHYAVPNNTMNVLTSFEMVNASGHYYQLLYLWSQVQTSWLPCVSNCSWQVDENGFSVADLAKGGVLHFIISWNGPFGAR